ncbi:MAG: eukaryotic-like serine/threonine-protein kinase [Microbacteriaceae bacterium]|jgi:cytoskeletal protein RodZ|nr:eukaryotic-like serine/threonine-protein kinase [Microbacteriaceae bacterium]
MRPTSGLTFGGRYQLSSRVAIGGMGEVWQATDLVIGRIVAIKILKDEYLGDPGFLERFRAEARHAALVNHEGIANVFDYGEEDGSAYLVMELVPGEALSTILERERVLSTDRVLDIVAQTASALHAAHSAGLVHRDIKPGNLLITPDGRVKITDFGIARIADQVPLTATGQVMGTVQYLSPEQASGRPASPTTDIYSLGIVAYEALAGRRPFTGESQVAIAMAQINEIAPDLPVTVSEPVRKLVFSCIAKNPADRPASAAHLARAAQALRRGDVTGATAAVPGIAAFGALVSGGAASGSTQATRILTSVDGAETPPTGPTETKGRNPWTWPLIALIGILVVVLIGTLIALLMSPGRNNAAPSVTATRVSQSPSPTPSATPTTASRVTITANQFNGMTASEASDALGKLGLVADILPATQPAPTAGQANTVSSVNPAGNVPVGSTIHVNMYGDVAPPTQPATPTASAPPATTAPNYPPSSSVTISWPAYTGCSPGTSLTGYVLVVSGSATFTPDNPIPPSASPTATVTLPATPGDTTVQYLAQCSGTNSPTSGAVTLTVAPAGP